MAKSNHDTDPRDLLIADLSGKLADAEAKVKQLEAELHDNWLLINSRRYKVASKASDVVHKALKITGIKRVSRGAKKAVAKSEDYLDKVNLIRKAKGHRGVIVHTGIPWDYELRQRPHHIAPRLADGGYLFVYIDPEAEPGLRRWISDNLLVVGGYDTLAKLSSLKGKLPLYYISIAGFPSSFDDLEEIKSYGFEIIYEYIDELDASINGDLEKQLGVLDRLEDLRPILVIASARKLYNQMVKRFTKKSVLLSQNAVDVDVFTPKKRSKQDAPKDLKPIIEQNKPIIGYYGAIASWLDYELINEVARKRPDYNFIFIGRDYDDGLRHLGKFDNIHYLGPKSYEELANYSYWFDCATIPFQNGEIAKSTSPLKLFEYMAMGIPTVCTRDLRECDGYYGVMLSKDMAHFMKNLDTAIEMKQDKSVRNRLVDHAKQNTWDARANDILRILNKLEA